MNDMKWIFNPLLLIKQDRMPLPISTLQDQIDLVIEEKEHPLDDAIWKLGSPSAKVHSKRVLKYEETSLDEQCKTANSRDYTIHHFKRKKNLVNSFYVNSPKYSNDILP